MVDALDFGTALTAGERIRLHSGGNSFARSATWPLTAPAEPWAVYVASFGQFRALAADFDVKLGDAEADALDLLEEMRATGMEAVLAKSGGGGFHVFATFTPPLCQQAMAHLAMEMHKRYRSLDPHCLRTNSAIRPPQAPHRNGSRSEVVGDPDVELAKLQRANDVETAVRLTSALRQSRLHSSGSAIARLTKNGRDILINGTNVGPDRSSSSTEWSFMLSAIQSGLSFDEITLLLLDTAHRGGERLRRQVADLGRARALTSLRRQHQRATAFIANNPAISCSGEARQQLLALSDLASRSAWKGVAGGTDRAVLEALITIALQVGSVTITASQRQLVEMAKVQRNTVAASIRRLTAAGWLRVERRGTRGTASTLRLLTGRVSQVEPLPTSNGGWETNGPINGIVLRETLHDAFRFRGLGRSAAMIYAAMDLTEPRSVRQIIQGSGRSSTTVYKYLPIFERLELAREVEDGFWVRVDQLLDLVAHEVGTLGTTEAQRERHRRERLAYEARLGLRREQFEVEA